MFRQTLPRGFSRGGRFPGLSFVLRLSRCGLPVGHVRTSVECSNREEIEPGRHTLRRTAGAPMSGATRPRPAFDGRVLSGWAALSRPGGWFAGKANSWPARSPIHGPAVNSWSIHHPQPVEGPDMRPGALGENSTTRGGGLGIGCPLQRRLAKPPAGREQQRGNHVRSG